jgi:hypothetical protein
MSVKCFFLEETNDAQCALRRYHSSEVKCDPGVTRPHNGTGYHNAMTPYAVKPIIIDPIFGSWTVEQEKVPHDDPRWPTHCACGYQFTDDDAWQFFSDRLYRRTDTGEVLSLRDAPPGAMWYASWMEDTPALCGPDGHALMVRLPDGHDWHVDAESSNCTRKGDLSHKCWVRHGTVPNITVDKNGETCRAGAGSILTPNWHGFLRNGLLVN